MDNNEKMKVKSKGMDYIISKPSSYEKFKKFFK